MIIYGRIKISAGSLDILSDNSFDFITALETYIKLKTANLGMTPKFAIIAPIFRMVMVVPP